MEPPAPNLFDLRPARRREWEMSGEGQTVVLVPKFEKGFLARWLMPRLAKPYIRVKLDAFGTFVWQQCDGRTSVAEIAERLRAEFGAAVEPVDDRIVLFMKRMQREELINL